MRLFLLKLLATITQKPRYFPVIEWSNKSWTHNIFRAFEYVFGRQYGIQCESIVEAQMVNGKIHLSKKMYTFEAVVANFETYIREALRKNKVGFEWIELPRLQLAGLFDQSTSVRLPIFTFAIAIDATADGFQAAGTSLTYAHTTSGSDRVILDGVWIFNGTISGVTSAYNGTSMTSLAGTTVNTDASGQLFMFGVANPTSGANNVVITNANSVQIFCCSASYTGVNQTTPFPDVATTGSSTGTSFSLSATSVSVDQSWLFATGRSPSKVPTASAGTVLRKTNGASGDAGWLIDSNGGRSTGANTLDYTYSGSSTSYWIEMAIAPTTATVNSGFFNFM